VAERGRLALLVFSEKIVGRVDQRDLGGRGRASTQHFGGKGKSTVEKLQRRLNSDRAFVLIPRRETDQGE